ncbi:hypothetical protein BGZ97_006565 [Linnemannia gamsii]|uniref:Uncharacterized protein n=1 Tax=Linnemannia gamsii TaxID=64522 RepID=A0A9P6QT50_9FUNG|nr:hypothetical protein BGZ97_006565 [Linnemannia gamsii]
MAGNKRKAADMSSQPSLPSTSFSAIPETSSTSSLTSAFIESAATSSPTAPVAVAGPSTNLDLPPGPGGKHDSFWRTPGVDKIVEWMSDAENMRKRLQPGRTVDADDAARTAATNAPPKKKKRGPPAPVDQMAGMLADFKTMDADQNNNFARIIVDSQKDHHAQLVEYEKNMRLQWAREEAAFRERLERLDKLAREDRQAEDIASHKKRAAADDELRERWRLRAADQEAQMKSREDRLEADKSEWKQEKAELKNEVKELFKVNIELKCQLSSLRKELELRRRSRSPPEIGLISQ